MSGHITGMKSSTPMSPAQGLGNQLKSAAQKWVSAPGLLILLFVASLGYIVLGGNRNVESMLHRFGGTEGASPVVDMPVG